MPRRPRPRFAGAPAGGLALVISILISFGALLSPAAADQSQASAEAPIEAAGAGTETGSEAAATRKAERQLRRAERKAARESSEVTASTPTEAQAAQPRGGSDSSSKTTRRAQRTAAKPSHQKSAGVSGASPAASRGSSASHKAEREEARHERQEERRLREEERRASGHETKKQHRERVAREVAEAGQGAQGSISRPGTGATGAIAAAGGTGEEDSSAASGLGSAGLAEAKGAGGSQAQDGSKASREPSRSSKARGTGRGNGVAGASTAGAPAAGESSSPGTSASSRGTRAGRHGSKGGVPSHAAARRSSPLVRTVTQIIGVVPGALWLLMGALALAAVAFAASSRLSARHARRLDQQRRALLEDVGLLQAALLPELPERLGVVTTSAAYKPASGPGAGGDFYDVFALPEGLLAILVGDVSGHGRDALPHTTLLRYTLRAYLEAGLEPREALRAAAPALERQLGGSFATVVLATFDPRERLLTYATAGHPHPLLTGLDPAESIIVASAPPIGTGTRTGTRQTVVSIPGETLVAFYTDGVIEARVVGGELYGHRRLAADLDGISSAAGPTAARLLDVVAAQADRRPDDMAACLLGIPGGSERPSVVAEQIELDGRETGRERARRFLAAAKVPEAEIAGVLSSARAIAADHGSALLTIEMETAGPRLTLTHDNVAPLRARALARTQEVAL